MMKLEKTNSTPEVIIDNNSFVMTGVCTPENPPKFFDEFKAELERLLFVKGAVQYRFHLDYFNTGSSKCLLNLFKAVSLSVTKDQIKIIWMYENGDEEMRESGELYSEIADMAFEFVEV